MLLYRWCILLLSLISIMKCSVVPGINTCGYDIFSHLTPGNQVYSPFSVGHALHSLLLGAGGNTHTQLHHLLKSPDQPHLHLNTLIKTLTRPREALELKVINKMFVSKDISLSAEYTALSLSHLHTTVHALDLQSPDAALAHVNSEIAKETNGKIQDLLTKDVLTEDVRLILVNILYFNGGWISPFKKYNTKPRPFYLSADSSGPYVNVPMMHQTDHFQYLESDDFQTAALGFKETRVELVIFKPKINIHKLADKLLNHEEIERIYGAMEYTEVDLMIPKMKVTSDLNLKSVLLALGLTDMFEDKSADFSKLTSSGRKELCVSEVLHKAYIALDEAGCEAAAAAAGMIMLGVPEASQHLPVQLHLDQPFLYLLRDSHSGAVLFAGRQVEFEGEQVVRDRTEL